MTKKLTALLYARTSKEDSATDSLSIESQLELCREYSEKKGYKVLREFADDGISGAASLDERPALSQAYGLHETADVLIIRDIDRLSRDTFGPAAGILGYFERAGVTIEFVNTPRGEHEGTYRAQIGMKAVFADFERFQIRERTMTGAGKHAKNGSFPHSKAPYGFIKVGEPKNWSLELDPLKSQVVMRIFSTYAEKDISLNGIATLLNSENIPSPDNAQWTKPTIKAILNRRAYAGKYEWRKTRPQSVGSKKTRKSDPDEIILIDVPRIVSDSFYEKVQEKLTLNKNHKRQAAKNPFPLRGRIRCLTCGRTYTRQTKTDKKSGKTYVYYQCTGSTNYRRQSGGRVCTERVLKAAEVDPDIFRAVLKQIESPEYVEELLAAQETNANERNAGALDRIKAVDKAILSAEQKLEKLLMSNATTQTQKTVDKIIAKSSAELKRLETEKQTLESSLVEAPAVDTKLIRSYWKKGNFNQVRTMLGEYADTKGLPLDDDMTDFLPDESIRQLYEEINLRGEIGSENGTRKLYLSTDLTEDRADVSLECSCIQ